MQGARSNAVLAARQMGGFIFNMHQSYFESDFDHSTMPEFQAMLKKPETNEYTIFPPVLFPDGVYDPSLKTLFRNPVLPKVSFT